MLYEACAGCGRSLDDLEVVLLDARPFCPTCGDAAGGNRESRVASAPATVQGEQPRFHVRLARESTTPGTLTARFFSDANEWCAGRMWWPRLLLLVWLISLFWKRLRDPVAWLLIDGLNLGIHELGHYAFYWLGEFMSTIGGSLLEVLAPIGAAVMFYRQRDYFAIAVASCWLGTAFFHVGSYAGDARARELPLVSPTSSDPMHDWFYILQRFGWLEHDQTIKAILHLSGATAMMAGLLFGGWLVLQMKNAKEMTALPG